MTRQYPSKEKRKEIALMHFDLMVSMSEGIEEMTIRPYLNWFERLNSMERGYFFGLVAGTYNKMLDRQDMKKIEAGRKSIIDFINNEKD